MRTTNDQQTLVFEPSQREEDALRAKAGALLKDKGLFKTVEALLKSIRTAPIVADQTASIVTLMQRLTPSPGQTIIVKGAFKRHAGGSMPITGSFEVSTESSDLPS